MAEPNIEIHPLSPGRRADYLEFFDHVAFAGNPKWANCFCYFPHADHAGKRWNVDDGATNRPAAAAMIDGGSMRGFLAYIDGQAVAWCNANILSNYTMFDEDERDPDTVGMIACFVVAESQRRKGIASALLEAACQGFKEAGITVVEAYPRPKADSAAENHLGPLSMYLAAGFEVVGEDGSILRVQKRL
jgi:GNAT superfamily N-acetyltransferase